MAQEFLAHILEEIDKHTGPDRMSKREALNWLQELDSDIEGRWMALEEEIEADGVDDSIDDEA